MANPRDVSNVIVHLIPSNKKVGRKKGKRNRKWGRNRAKCAAYRAGNRREHNKARRIARDAKRSNK